MEEATNKGLLERLFIGAGVKNELGLAAALGISGQSVYNAKKKGKIPPAWGIEIAKTFGVRLDWIFFGQGPVHTGESSQGEFGSEQSQRYDPIVAPICPRCEKLEIKLERVENQRDNLVEENRNLMKENAMLREECATLRERQRKDQCSLFEGMPVSSRNQLSEQTRG